MKAAMAGIGLIIGMARQIEMAHFRVRLATQHFTINHRTTANAGANRVVKRHALPLACAPQAFRQRGPVHIGINRDGAAQCRLEAGQPDRHWSSPALASR